MAGPTRWRVDLPPHWRPFLGPDGAVVARPPGHAGCVVPHVLVARERVPLVVRVGDLADRSVDAVRSFGRDPRLLGGGSASVDSLERCTRVVTFESERPRVEVVQLLAFVAQAEPAEETTRDVLQFVGTCALDELPRFATAFTAVVESIRERP
jgi:hypothetical protein